MGRPCLVALALAGAAACGSPRGGPGDARPPDGGAEVDAGPDPTDGARSGVRLKVIWWQTADGLRVPTGAFRDTLRDEDCTIFAFVDGALRCVPRDLAYLSFADAACSQPIGEAYGGEGCPRAAPRYAVEYADAACTYGATRIRPLGAARASKTYYVRSSLGGCLGPFTASSSTFYDAGAPLDLTTFAAFDLREDEGRGALHHRFVTTADGFRFPFGTFDTTNQTACAPRSAVGYERAVCGPTDAMYAGYASDAACANPLAALRHECAVVHRPPYAVLPRGGASRCPGEPPRYAPVGAAYGASALYSAGTTCTAATRSPTVDYFQLFGAIVPPPMTRAVEPAAGARLRPVYVYADDDPAFRIRDGLLRDDALASDCYLYDTGDGRAACVPAGPGYAPSGLYADRACATAAHVYAVTTGPAGCFAPAVGGVSASYDGADACLGNFTLRSIGAVTTAPLYERAGTGCVPHARPAGTTYYQLGDVRPTSALAAVTRAVGP